MLILLNAAGSSHSAQTDGPSQDDTYKAVFIHKFIQYVQWPDPDTSSVFVIGILGDTDVAAPLREIARKRTVGDRKLIVEPKKGIEDLGTCHVLFIAGSKQDLLEETKKQVEDRHILTIGDTEGFGHQGIAINFTFVKEKLKFEINRRAIERAGLKVGSQLLKLGIPVDEEKREGK